MANRMSWKTEKGLTSCFMCDNVLRSCRFIVGRIVMPMPEQVPHGLLEK